MYGGTIEGPTVVIGADESRVETALSGLKTNSLRLVTNYQVYRVGSCYIHP